MKELIKLVDGAILKIEQDNWCRSGGCDTCGYGAIYISELIFILTNYRVDFELDSDDSHSPLTEEISMKVILPNYDVIREMTEDDFCDWVIAEFSKECDAEARKTYIGDY